MAAANAAVAIGGGRFNVLVVIAWAAVAIPILWGVEKALESAVKIFQ